MTNRQTDRHTQIDHATPSIAIARVLCNARGPSVCYITPRRGGGLQLVIYVIRSIKEGIVFVNVV